MKVNSVFKFLDPFLLQLHKLSTCFRIKLFAVVGSLDNHVFIVIQIIYNSLVEFRQLIKGQLLIKVMALNIVKIKLYTVLSAVVTAD